MSPGNQSVFQLLKEMAFRVILIFSACENGGISRRKCSIFKAFFAKQLADSARILLLIRLEARRSVSVKCIWEIPVLLAY